MTPFFVSFLIYCVADKTENKDKDKETKKETAKDSKDEAEVRISVSKLILS